MGILTKGQYTFGNKTKTEIIQLTAPLTLTGTASTTSLSNVVNGTGTLFLTELIVGQIIRFSTGNIFTIATIVSNTQLTITINAGVNITNGAISLMNPKRIKFGASVFNVTDRYPMYYSGDFGVVGSLAWQMGGFCNGQIVPLCLVNLTASVTEGQVLQVQGSAIRPYISGLDPAIAVAYNLVYDDCCLPSAVCGIHNTDSSGAIPKGNFTQPSASVPSVIDDGATSTADNCGIAVVSAGTPVAGEVEMLVNFHERL